MKMRVASPAPALSSSRAISCVALQIVEQVAESVRGQLLRRRRSACRLPHDQHRPAMLPSSLQMARARARSACVRRYRPARALSPISRSIRARAWPMVRPGEHRGHVSRPPRPAPRMRHAGGRSITRFSIAPSSLTQHRQRLVGRERHEAHLAQHQLSLGHHHQPGTGRQARQRGGGCGRALPRPGPTCDTPRFDRGPLLGRRLERLHHAVDEQAKPDLGRHAARRWRMRRGEQSRAPPDPASRCGSRRARGCRPERCAMVRDPIGVPVSR